MPLLHCNECHHEYEAVDKKEPCDWCGAEGYVLAKKTGLENFCKAFSVFNKYHCGKQQMFLDAFESKLSSQQQDLDPKIRQALNDEFED